MPDGIGIALSDDNDDDVPFNRSSFPPGFIFGSASSAYQYEGAYDIDGKGPSIWDWWTRTHKDKIEDGSNGTVAEETYYRYKEDIQIMKEVGLDAYRFSISWPRILPRGRISGGVNPLGIAYYNYLIDEVIKQGLEPFVTIFHWDLPRALEKEYQGFLNETIVDDFREYAELCFALFGDRVKHWITVNEPWSYSVYGYAYGLFPPGRCSKDANNVTSGLTIGKFARLVNESLTCDEGNSGTEPYLVSHHLLLAHAHAVKVYRDKYQTAQNGKIGISLCVEWMVPYSNSSEDEAAADRALAFMYGWFMQPLNNGTYPDAMVTHVSHLPSFNESQKKMLTGSFDFIGLNYYTASYAENANCSRKPNYVTDACVNSTQERDGKYIGNRTGSNWLYIYPEGIQDLLLYTKRNYNYSTLYITENGVDRRNLLGENHLVDPIRRYYHKSHLLLLQNITQNKEVSVSGYFMWSLLDNFEWAAGYTVRFGIIFIDYGRNLSRTWKDSACWFNNFLLSKYECPLLEDSYML